MLIMLRILEDFLEVMNGHCEKLVEILARQCGRGEVDIFPLVTHCALDIICETAMGRNINAQEDSDTPYVRAIYQASDIVFQRQRSPWLWGDAFFSFTPAGFKWRKTLDTLHGFTNKVIADRRAEYARAEVKAADHDPDVGMKKKLAFLDLLIEASEVTICYKESLTKGFILFLERKCPD